MKTKRIINAVFWSVIALACCIGVCIQWHAQGCEWQSCAMGCAWFIACPTGILATIDAAIQGK